MDAAADNFTGGGFSAAQALAAADLAGFPRCVIPNPAGATPAPGAPPRFTNHLHFSNFAPKHAAIK